MTFPFNSIMWGFLSPSPVLFFLSSSLGVSGQIIQFDTFLTELAGCLTKSIRCIYMTGNCTVYFVDKVGGLSQIDGTDQARSQSCRLNFPACGWSLPFLMWIWLFCAPAPAYSDICTALFSTFI